MRKIIPAFAMCGCFLVGCNDVTDYAIAMGVLGSSTLVSAVVSNGSSLITAIVNAITTGS